jgi:hypothetical protein
LKGNSPRKKLSSIIGEDVAQTIPEKLPSRASQGEHRLFALLKSLPDNVVVYYEPVVSNRYPDFVVILPELGVLVIEVKGWSLKDIIEANSHCVRIWNQQREVLKNHPLQQAREYKFKLMDRLREDSKSSELLHTNGPHFGGFRFPFGSFAILSNISREQLDGSRGSEDIFPNAHVATRDQLLDWENLKPEDFTAVLKTYFDPFWDIDPMTPNQVDIIKATLHPEILLALNFGSDAMADEPTVKVLDLQQEAIARNIGDGHRLVFGVAGSGKTVILLSRAKLISRLNPSARVLVLCFNVPLSIMLADALRHCSTVTVFHFDGWARSNNVIRDFQDKAQLNDHSLLGRRLLQALNNGAPDANRFDVVLIDEAQDFPGEWYQCAIKSLKDPVNGELLVVGDGSQGVYGQKRISWRQLGIQAQGRTKYLEHNYRNTRPILELASLFSVKNSDGDEDCLRAPLVDPAKSKRPSGKKPMLLKSRTREEEVAKTVQVIRDLLDGHWFGMSIKPVVPNEIGVLYRHAGGDNHHCIEKLQASLKVLDQGVKSVWLSERNAKARHRIGEEGVKIMTMHAAKGLQFRAVIVLFAHECPANFPNKDVSEERCLFYVALTRPEDFLVISSSRPSPFISEMENSGFVEVR